MNQQDYFYSQPNDLDDPNDLPWGALPFEATTQYTPPPAEEIPPPTDADCPPERDIFYPSDEDYGRSLEGFTHTDPFAGTPFDDAPPYRKAAAPKPAPKPTHRDALVENPPQKPTHRDALVENPTSKPTHRDALVQPTRGDASEPMPNDIISITRYCAAHMPSSCITFHPKLKMPVVDEWAFVTWLSDFADVRCINYRFYLFGIKIAGVSLKRIILEIVRNHAEITAPKLTSIVNLLESFTTTEAPVVDADSIAFVGKTLTLHPTAQPTAQPTTGTAQPTVTLRMQSSTDFSFCRIPHAFDATVGEPTRLLAFLNGLFAPEDLPTVQEYLGYCLMPSTKVQKALFIIGKGGEGKSRLSVLMKLILGEAAVVSSVAKIGERFFTSVLENRLLFIDDDLQTAKFATTDAFKSLVTCETSIMVEQKGTPHYEMQPYARFLLMGNQSIGSLHDKSHGFYRRIHIIHTLPAPAGRVNNPTLIQDIWAAEQAEILLWLVKGALRLARQNYILSESESSRAALTALKEEDNTALSFLKEQTFTYGAHCSVTSSMLSTKYKDWCLDNDLYRVGGQAFKQTCEAFFAKGGASYQKTVQTAQGRVRGYTGVAFSGQ